MKIASILLAGIIVGAVFPIFIIVQLELPDKLNTPAFWTLFVLIFLGGIFGLISGGIIKSEPGYRPVLAVRIILGVIIGIIAATVATVCFLISLWPAGRSGGEGAPVVIGTIVLAIGLWPVLLIPGILVGGFGGVISEQLLWRMTRTIFKMMR